MQRTWEELIRTQGADLLSAIPLMAHALHSSDRDLQLLYCSLLECQRDMQRTSDAVQAHVQLNVSIAREVAGHPGCQDLVILPSINMNCCDVWSTVKTASKHTLPRQQ